MAVTRGRGGPPLGTARTRCSSATPALVRNSWLCHPARGRAADRPRQAHSRPGAARGRRPPESTASSKVRTEWQAVKPLDPADAARIQRTACAGDRAADGHVVGARQQTVVQTHSAVELASPERWQHPGGAGLHSREPRPQDVDRPEPGAAVADPFRRHRERRTQPGDRSPVCGESPDGQRVLSAHSSPVPSSVHEAAAGAWCSGASAASASLLDHASRGMRSRTEAEVSSPLRAVSRARIPATSSSGLAMPLTLPSGGRRRQSDWPLCAAIACWSHRALALGVRMRVS